MVARSPPPQDMEEIEILPRDGYLHTVHVTRVPCSIQWWFSTKRKNIDFGLFRRAPQGVTGGDDASLNPSPAGSLRPTGSRGSTMGSIAGKQLGFMPSTSQNQLETELHPKGQLQHQQQLQRNVHFKLQDRNVIELMPLKHYESSKTTIKGAWTAADPGTYILYFDNSFSKNTSKRLSFCVAVRELKDARGSQSSKQPTLLSGWLLKKKRKRMQGWANRWFAIQGHWLTYSTTEGGIPRAKVDIVNAVVSMAKQDCLITVDGDEGFFQLRAHTQPDFEAWVAALKKIKEAATTLADNVHHTDGATLSAGAILHQPTPPNLVSEASFFNRSINADDATQAHASFVDYANKLSALISDIKISSDNDVIGVAQRYLKSIRDSESAIYRLVSSSEKSSRPSMSRWETAISEAPSICLSASRTSWFSGSGSEVFYDTNDVLDVSRVEDERSPSATPASKRINDESISIDGALGTSGSTSSDYSSPSVRIGHAIKSMGISAQAGGDSSSTSDSDIAVEGLYDDAQDNNDDIQSARMRQDLIRDPDFIEALARNNIQQPRLSESADAKNAKDSDRDAKQAQNKDLDNHPLVTLGYMHSKLTNYEPRTTLPAESSEVNVSLISILRKNVGKDLTSIAMPLVMNEPINALQALCEELMYCRLLQKADDMSDSLDRLMHVAAFAISTLSSKKNRAERKPFNPLLGETYEMVDPLGGYRFISEKVSHHPPVMACYADSPSYRFWQDSSGKSKFWGKSMEFIQTSNVHIELLKHKDHFTYCKPSALVRGLITGNRTVDFTGEMVITNESTGDRCTVNFKEASMFSSSNDMVECHLYCGSSGHKVERVLRGSWSSYLRFEKSTTQSEALWTAVSLPPESERYYRFSYFTMRLNELAPGTQQDLPPTDTRFRPDQRAYEEGRIDDAEAIKSELEEAQRDRKRERDEAGKAWTPQWFEEREDMRSPSGFSWQYKGGYWDARASHAFPKSVELWKSSL
ncbi:Oxysterol-binding protein 3 [Coemansia spiralis]|uniref:Oxysterol-binding protein 3 n=1 Tax=Coemansia spiralis TaxID=417178 RepID=A0A9W8KXR8_9FUNG|nr:Oxysterol-binding protein 3 [Coemansia spiralis]